MRRYETTYILRPNLGENLINEIIDRTSSLIANDGGSIINQDLWGLKNLAYDIKKESQGYYVYIDFAAPETVIDEMERIFRIDDNIIRYLTVKLANSIDQDTVTSETKRLAEETIAAGNPDENESGDEQSETENNEQADK